MMSVYMKPVKMGKYRGSAVLCTRLIASGGITELRAFAQRCGFPRPTFTIRPSYRVSIPVFGRSVVEIVQAKGAVPIKTDKEFREMIRQSEEGE